MRVIAFTLCLLALTASGNAQVIGIDDLNPVTGTSNTFPWNQLAGFTTLHVYSAATLCALGVTAGAVLTDLAVAPSSGVAAAVNTYNAPVAQMLIGHLSVPVPVPGAWGTHLAAPITVHSLTSGPYTFPWTLNTHASLPGFAAAGFVWDGVRSIGIQYTSSGATTGGAVTGGFNARRTGTQLRHSVAVFNATTQLPTSNGLFAMEVRMTFTPGLPSAPYQVNSPDSSLNWNGVNGTNCVKANTTVCAGTTVTVTGSTVVPGTVFEWGYNLAATVPNGGGAVVTPGGQIVNLDIGGGGIFFLNGGFAPLFAPHPGVLPLGFAMPGGLTVSAQQIVLPTAHPEGFTLSQAGQVNGVAGQVGGPGPVGDDASLLLTAGVPVAGTGVPTCFAGYTPPAIALYGTTYTQYSVVTNGRVNMGSVINNSFTPAAVYLATDGPFAGAHIDFNTLVAGSINVNNVGGNLVVNYVGIGYFGQAGTASTLTLTIFPNSDVTLTGTLGLPILAGTDAYIGVHPGGAVTMDAGLPATYVGAGGYAGGVAGFSHGLYSADMLVTPLMDPAEALTFTYNGSGYNIAY